MNQKSTRCLDAFESTIQYGTIHPLIPAVPRVTALYTGLTTITTALRDFGAAQINSRSSFRGAVDNRLRLKGDILESLREINKIARALDKVAFPNAREHFRMPKSKSYANVAAFAQSFATHAEAMEAAFTDRGRPATFVADLRALATALDSASAAKHTGLTAQVGATAGIAAKVREGVAVLRELDSIITPLIKADEVLLATWKSAVNIEADPVSEDEEEEETPPGSGTASAVSGQEGGLPA